MYCVDMTPAVGINYSHVFTDLLPFHTWLFSLCDGISHLIRRNTNILYIWDKFSIYLLFIFVKSLLFASVFTYVLIVRAADFSFGDSLSI